VADYVEREAAALTDDRDWLDERTPFRRGDRSE